MAEIEKLTGHGAPSVLLPGAKGQIYEDLDTGRLYECKGERGFIKVDGDDQDNQFNWVLKGVDISYNDLQDKPEQCGGVGSWNDLTDRPFYENAITWDGSTDGRDSVTIEGLGTFYKVSDLTVDEQSVMEDTMFLSDGFSIPVDQLNIVNLDGGYIFTHAFLCATSTVMKNEYVSIDVPSTGIYFYYGEKFYTSKLIVGVVKLDAMYIPQPIINLDYDGSAYSVDQTFDDIKAMIFSFGEAIIIPSDNCDIHVSVAKFISLSSNSIRFLGADRTTDSSNNWSGLSIYLIDIKYDGAISVYVDKKTITL